MVNKQQKKREEKKKKTHDRNARRPVGQIQGPNPNGPLLGQGNQNGPLLGQLPADGASAPDAGRLADGVSVPYAGSLVVCASALNAGYLADGASVPEVGCLADGASVPEVGCHEKKLCRDEYLADGASVPEVGCHEKKLCRDEYLADGASVPEVGCHEKKLCRDEYLADGASVPEVGCHGKKLCRDGYLADGASVPEVGCLADGASAPEVGCGASMRHEAGSRFGVVPLISAENAECPVDKTGCSTSNVECIGFEPMDVDVSDSASETSSVNESLSDLCPPKPKKGRPTKKQSKIANLAKSRKSLEERNENATSVVDSIESSPQFIAPLQPAKRGPKPKVKAQQPAPMEVEEQTIEQLFPARNTTEDLRWYQEVNRQLEDIVLNDPGHEEANVPLFLQMEEMGCEIITHCGTNLAKVDVRELSVDHRQMMTNDLLYIYLCYIATIDKRNVAVMIHRSPAEFDENIELFNFGMEQNPIDVLLIPIVFQMHFAIAMKMPGRNAIFYDSLPAHNRLTADVVGYIERAVNVAWPHIAPEEVQVDYAQLTSYNRQDVDLDDGRNCGFYTSIYAELYLIDPDHMIINDFSIIDQRQRIVNILEEIGESRIPNYMPPEGDDYYYEEVFDDDDGDAQSAPTISSSFESVTSNGSFGSDTSVNISVDRTVRRSARIANTPRVKHTQTRAYTPRGLTKSPKLTPLPYCHKKHDIKGCFATSANHIISYYDSGDIGDKVCPYCKALLLKSEDSSMCCRKGQVKLEPFSEWPNDMMALAADPNKGSVLRKTARRLNDSLAFGSFEAGRATVGQLHPAFRNDRFPPVILMNGSIRHSLGNIFVRPGENPVMNQLYIIDPDASANALQANPQINALGVDIDVLQSLLTIIRREHNLSKMLSYVV